METRANFFLLGAVAIGGAAFIMLFAAWLVGSDWRSGYHVYDIVFQGPVRGLSEGGEVRFNGIKVGEVQTLRVDEEDASKVVARVRVSATTPLRTDSRAQLEAIGLTGVTLIQLSAGTEAGEPLRPRMGQAPPRINAVVGTIEGLLTDENAQRVTETLANLREISAALAEDDSVVREAAVAARDLAEAARAIASLSRTAEAELSGLSRGANSTFSEAESAFAQIDSAADVAANESLPQFSRAASELNRTSVAVNDALTRLERSPAAYLSGQSVHVVEVAP